MIQLNNSQIEGVIRDKGRPSILYKTGRNVWVRMSCQISSIYESS